MTSRTPPSKRNADYQALQQGRQLQSMSPGALGGRFAPAAPVLPTEHLAAIQVDAGGASTDATASQIDLFTLGSGGPQDLTLTFLPADQSWNVSLNGITAENGVDYSITGQTLSLLTPIAALTGDLVQIQYDYLVGVPIAVPPSFGAYPDAVMAASPIAYYRLDDAGAAMKDFTAHHHDATSVSGAGYTRGQSSLLPTDTDTSTLFTDNATRFSVPGHTDFDFTTQFSVELWTDFQTAGTVGVVAYDTRWAFVLAGGTGQLLINNVAVAISGSSLTSGAGSKHVVVTWDGSVVLFYKNSVLLSTVSYAGTASNSGPFLLVGSAGNTSLGKLDEVAIYNYALSSTQIAAHYAAA